MAANPTVSLRALGFMLRRFRTERKIKLDVAAKVVSLTGGSLSKTETGKQAMNPALVKQLLDYYEVADPAIRAECNQLAEQGRKRGWWSPYTDLVNAIYIGLEGGASRICYHETSLVPGLLQTKPYIEALIRSEAPDVSKDELDRRCEVRLERQRILTRLDDPCGLVAVLDEAVLRRPIGPSQVMVDQIDHIISMTRQHNIDIQVVPFASGPYSSLGSRYTILRFPDPEDPGVAFLEQLHYRDVFVEDAEDIRRFTDAFERSRAAAEPPARSLALLKQARDNYHQQGKD